METNLPVEIPLWDDSTLFGAKAEYNVNISGTREHKQQTEFDKEKYENWNGDDFDPLVINTKVTERDYESDNVTVVITREIPFDITVSHSAYENEIPDVDQEYVRMHLMENNIDPDSVMEIKYIDITVKTRLYDSESE